MQVITRQRRELKEEQRRFQEKERKARWYQRRKSDSNQSASNITSDDSDIPVSSPSSLVCSAVNFDSDSDSGEGVPSVF